VLVIVPGMAATLGGLSAGKLGGGGAVVSSCDTNGFTVSYATSGGNVTSATIDGIADPACEGGQLQVTVANGTTSIGVGGPTVVPTDAGTADNSVTVPVSPQPAAAQVNRVHVAIAGP
jgi:putative aminopeptidase FrvX